MIGIIGIIHIIDMITIVYPSSQFYEYPHEKSHALCIQASLRSSWVKARFPGAASAASIGFGIFWDGGTWFIEHFVVEVEKYRVLDQVPVFRDVSGCFWIYPFKSIWKRYGVVYSEKFVEWMDVPQNFNPQTRFKPDARCYNLNAPTSACCDRNELPLPATPFLHPFEILNVSWSESNSNQIWHVPFTWSDPISHFLQWCFPCSLQSVFFWVNSNDFSPPDPWMISPPVAWIWPSAACGRRKRPWSAWAPAMLRRGASGISMGVIWGIPMYTRKKNPKNWRFQKGEWWLIIGLRDTRFSDNPTSIFMGLMGGREVRADVQCGDVDLALHGDEDVFETSSTLSGIIRYMMLSLISFNCG